MLLKLPEIRLIETSPTSPDRLLSSKDKLSKFKGILIVLLTKLPSWTTKDNRTNSPSKPDKLETQLLLPLSKPSLVILRRSKPTTHKRPQSRLLSLCKRSRKSKILTHFLLWSSSPPHSIHRLLKMLSLRCTPSRLECKPLFRMMPKMRPMLRWNIKDLEEYSSNNLSISTMK